MNIFFEPLNKKFFPLTLAYFVLVGVELYLFFYLLSAPKWIGLKYFFESPNLMNFFQLGSIYILIPAIVFSIMLHFKGTVLKFITIACLILDFLFLGASFHGEAALAAPLYLILLAFVFSVGMTFAFALKYFVKTSPYLALLLLIFMPIVFGFYIFLIR